MSTALSLNRPAALPPAVAKTALASVARALLAPQAPVREAEPRELAGQIRTLVQRAASDLGHRNSASEPLDVAGLTITVTKMVLRDFPNLKPAELEEAWQRGGSGAYRVPGDFDLVSGPTFRRWLTAYVEGARHDARQALRAAELAQQADARAATARDLTTAERVTEAVRVIVTGERATRHPLAALVYKWLKEWGLLTGWKPAEWKSSREAWYAHLEKQEAAKLRQQAKERGEAGKHDARRFTGLLQEVALLPTELAEPLRLACQRRVVGAWSAECADLSQAALRGLLTDAATLPPASNP